MMNLGYISLLLNPFKPIIPWKLRRFRGQAIVPKMMDSVVDVYPQVIWGLQERVGHPVADKRNTKTGPAERQLKLIIVKHQLKSFYSEMIIPVERHRYAPDLMFVDEKHGVYIDIENDEPYTLSHGKMPIHYLGKDDERNTLIAQSGWTVVRFSEHQLFTEPLRCLRYVYDVARQINPNVSIPTCLLHIKPIEREPRWSLADSRQMIKEDYRWTYLGKSLLMRLSYRWLTH